MHKKEKKADSSSSSSEDEKDKKKAKQKKPLATSTNPYEGMPYYFMQGMFPHNPVNPMAANAMHPGGMGHPMPHQGMPMPNMMHGVGAQGHPQPHMMMPMNPMMMQPFGKYVEI
jgi:hypothetical protein